MRPTFLLPLVLAVSLMNLLAPRTGATESHPVTVGHSLPLGFAVLVPQGAKVTAPSWGGNHMGARVTFYASRPVGNEAVSYEFELQCYSDKAWRALGPAYHMTMEQDADRARRGYAARVAHYTGNGDGSEIYPPEPRTYSWGKGISQRKDWHEIDAITGHARPIVTTYACSYFGIVNQSTFELKVVGREESLEDANAWAARVAARAGQITPGSLTH